MKRYLQNINLECWHHLGRLGVSEPSICLFRADTESCDPLLVAIDEVEQAGAPSKRKLSFQASDRENSCVAIRLILSPESDELRQMCISLNDSTVEIDVTPRGLNLLKEAVTVWREGSEDFGLAPTWERNRRRELGTKDLNSGELWFWGPYYNGP